MTRKFFEMLEARWAGGARVCIGLDSDWKKIPVLLTKLNKYPDVRKFNRDIVEATAHIALCYKPNIAFYSGPFRNEAQRILADTIDDIHNIAPDVPVILDAKRGDIGNTNYGYLNEAFLEFEADAVTVSPYFGMEAMKPFLDEKNKGIIVLCRTSNPGAGEFQDLAVSVESSESGLPKFKPLYQVIAEHVATKWNYNNNCALVVGATYPDELAQVRKIVGDMWLLVPGVGTQGGDVEKVVKNGINSRGSGIIVNSSSGIIFASSDHNFAKWAYFKTQGLTDEMNEALRPGSVVDKTV